MRKDMNKVVVERERGGSTRRNRKWGKRLPFVPDADYEDQPKFVSSGRRRQYGSDCKWFTDVLRPLEGFLHANLGRPWDKVHSGLRHGLDVRKVTGRHILLDGQWYLVEYECVEIAGRESHLRWDVAERKQVRLTWGDHRVAIGKRQSNREEVHWIRACIAAWEKEVRRV